MQKVPKYHNHIA
ncbi:hypothetical protein CP8484711_1858, partial [Chlamydia psittaci 84-8471/1]